jgi:predicted nucleotidyltransferase
MQAVTLKEAQQNLEQLLIPEHYDALVVFCQRYHIRRLALFGSILRDDFRPDSDVDVLVEFAPGYTPGLGFIRMQDELSQLFQGRQVDLMTPKFLNARIRDQILTKARAIYAEG